MKQKMLLNHIGIEMQYFIGILQMKTYKSLCATQLSVIILQTNIGYRNLKKIPPKYIIIIQSLLLCHSTLSISESWLILSFPLVILKLLSCAGIMCMEYNSELFHFIAKVIQGFVCVWCT